MAGTIKTKMCLICNKTIPGDIFEEHFVKCRNKKLQIEQEKVNVQFNNSGFPVTKKGCGCERKR